MERLIKSSGRPHLEQAVVKEIDRAFELTRSFLSAQISFQELEQTWQELSVSLGKLGYRLKLVREEETLIVEVENLKLTPHTPGLAFCFLCNTAMTVEVKNLFGNHLFCNRCLYGRKEAL